MHSKFPGDLLIKHKPAVSGLGGILRRNAAAATERCSVAEQIWQIE